MSSETSEVSGRVRAEPWAIPVLYYHRLDPAPDHYTAITPEELRRHLGILKQRFEFITVRRALTMMRDGVSPAGKLVLSFDDGYECNHALLGPILDDLEIRATFFLIAAALGQMDTWRSLSGRHRRHMSVANVRELLAAGHDVGSHCLTHRALDQLEVSLVAHEIERSITVLQNLFGIPIESLAYPYGTFTATVTEHVARRLAVAFSTVRSQARCWRTQPHRLRRIFVPSGVSDDEVLSTVLAEATLCARVRAHSGHGDP